MCVGGGAEGRQEWSSRGSLVSILYMTRNCQELWPQELHGCICILKLLLWWQMIGRVKDIRLGKRLWVISLLMEVYKLVESLWSWHVTKAWKSCSPLDSETPSKETRWACKGMLKFNAIFLILAEIRKNPERWRWLVKYVTAYLCNEIPLKFISIYIDVRRYS